MRRFMPMSRAERAAALAVLLVPVLVTASVMSVAVDPGAGAVTAALALCCTSSVVLWSLWAGYVGPVLATAGMSGLWAVGSAAAAWAVPWCPPIGEACQPMSTKVAVAALVGSELPWLVFVVGTALHLVVSTASRWVGRLRRRRRLRQRLLGGAKGSGNPNLIT